MRPPIDLLDTDQSLFRPQAPPQEAPSLADCFFYTCMDYPDGSTVERPCWDIRGGFDQYVGHHPVAGKTLLDVGTASGFLAFSAEAAGATVTAFDARHAREFERVPFGGSGFIRHRGQWIADTNHYLDGLKRSFWYSWHRLGSSVAVVHAPITALWRWEERFDVVVAGAIIEHVSDPVPFIASLAGLARETVVIAFTPMIDSDELTMTTMNDWTNPRWDYGWWRLSRGLYRRIFDNLGFDLSISIATATDRGLDPPLRIQHPTIVARRR